MLYNIDQPQIQYFLPGLVKSESELLDQFRLNQGYENWWKLWLMFILTIFSIFKTWPVTLSVQA